MGVAARGLCIFSSFQHSILLLFRFHSWDVFRFSSFQGRAWMPPALNYFFSGPLFFWGVFSLDDLTLECDPSALAPATWFMLMRRSVNQSDIGGCCQHLPIQVDSVDPVIDHHPTLSSSSLRMHGILMSRTRRCPQGRPRPITTTPLKPRVTP